MTVIILMLVRLAVLALIVFALWKVWRLLTAKPGIAPRRRNRFDLHGRTVSDAEYHEVKSDTRD